MIIDSLQNAVRYKSLHPLFAKAFEYVLSQSSEQFKSGSIQIDGDKLKAIAIEANGSSSEESLKGFECHDRYIDIQVSLSGNETYAWKPREHCEHPQALYDEKRDVTFFNDAPDTFFNLQAGQFAIFFPQDVHTAMINAEGQSIRKIVMKVLID
ncbi:MAG: DUF386 domain-containing protein [Sphingobacteriales bacterium]|nr:MAG: DUF386 domain-containing protein [Sphingobacteriales bacterium]